MLKALSYPDRVYSFSFIRRHCRRRRRCRRFSFRYRGYRARARVTCTVIHATHKLSPVRSSVDNPNAGT